MDIATIITVILIIVILYILAKSFAGPTEHMVSINNFDTFFADNYIDDIPIFVINLKSRPQRKKRCVFELKRNGLTGTFIEGVDGTELDLLELQNKGIIDGNSGSRLLRRGEIGCYMSHIKCWDKILASDSPYGLVLEDDAYFKSRFREKFDDVFSAIKDMKWDIISLGRRCRPEWFDDKDCLSGDFIYSRDNVHAFYPDVVGYGLHAYIIKKDTIKKLLQKTFPINVPIDVMIPEEHDRENIRVISFLNELVTVFDVNNSDTVSIK